MGQAGSLFSTWLTSPNGTIPANSPWGVFFTTLQNHWLTALLIGLSCFLAAGMIWAISRWDTRSEIHSSSPTAQDRVRMLGRLRLRYKQMLEQSLQGAVQIELGLVSRSAAVQQAVSLALRLPERPDQPLPPHTSIVEAFEQAQQELLIMGEPGAGKSTVLVELAHHLVEQAEQDTIQPLPVLLPLSSWAVKRPPLEDWLIEQVATLYDVPKRLSRQWVQAQQFLPLLDGLDEMSEAARPACIETINTYHREHLGPLVICSRTNEYDMATKFERLALHAAVVIQPLSYAQVDTYLKTLDKPLAGLRIALKKNMLLRNVATTPLILQVLMLTYHGTSVRELSQKEAQLREQIWADYIQKMVERKGDTRRYPLHATTTRLKWLASEMRRRNQTIFFLEQLQPDWLPKRRRIFYHWSSGLLVGLVYGLLGGLLVGLLIGLIEGLITGLIVGLIGGLITGLFVKLRSKIEPAEALVWSLRRLGFGLFFGSFVGLIEGLIVGLLTKQVYGLVYGLVLGLVPGLVFGFSRKQLTERLMLSPNEGIQRSLKNGLRVLLIGGLVFGLVSKQLLGLVSGWNLGLVFGWALGLASGLSAGLFSGLEFGLLAVLQHYTLRFWLARSDVFPWKAIPFLEDATARILLRRVGGGYSFTHRMLLDHFANTGATPSTNASPTQVTPP